MSIIKMLKTKKKLGIMTVTFIISIAILEIVLYSIMNPEFSNILNQISNFKLLMLIVASIGLLVSAFYLSTPSKDLSGIDDKVKRTAKENEINIENNVTTTSNTYRILNYQIKQLNEQIIATESKASTLLTTGITFIIVGIAFYFIAMVTWQFLLWGKNPNTSNIIGMIECTGIFIFFEIVAAWYLKQYRYYVDKSTFLVKVKAIFDKYLINYFLAEENKFKSITYKNLFEEIAKEINWPKDTHMQKNKSDDIHESLLGTIKELSSLLKNQGDKESTKEMK